MYYDFNFSDVLAGSAKAAQPVEDVIFPASAAGPRPPLRPEFDEAGALSERGLIVSTGLATGTSKRTSDAALGARRPCHMQFTATPAAPSIAARGLGKPTVSALH